MSLEITVNSILEYIGVVLQLHQTSPNDEFVFRGQADCNWPILPAIGRTINNDASLLQVEENLIELARYKIPIVFDRTMTPIDRLALLQHYGMPTRLLDVTSNPLVALYFACKREKEPNTDAEVIVFERRVDDVKNVGIHQAIADTFRMRPHNTATIIDFYDEIMCDNTNVIINKIAKIDIAEIIINVIKNNIMFVRSTEQLARQQAQQGSYILFANDICFEGDDYSEAHFIQRISDIPKDEDHIIKRIIIPADSTHFIVNDLKKLGITDGTLFPDHIDLMCQQIVKNETARLLWGSLMER